MATSKCHNATAEYVYEDSRHRSGWWVCSECRCTCYIWEAHVGLGLSGTDIMGALVGLLVITAVVVFLFFAIFVGHIPGTP